MRVHLSGERHETGVLWPWDCLQFLWNQQKFRGWAHDIEEDLEFRVEEFWKHLEHLPFYTSLQLDNPAGTIPIAWHADGVKVYKTQKVWVYSFSSCIRKGPSLATKMLFVCIRDSLIVKFMTHDSVGRLIGYCMDVMMTGNFPEQDFEGAPFQPGSVEAQRAGSPFVEAGSLPSQHSREIKKPEFSSTNLSEIGQRTQSVSIVWHQNYQMALYMVISPTTLPISNAYCHIQIFWH